jgi:hypothetical protein
MSSSSGWVFMKHAHFTEGDHCLLLPRISSTMTLKPRMVCFQEGENDEIMHMFATSSAYIRMPTWPPPFMIVGRQSCDATCSCEDDFELRMTQM